ncbi:MAG: NAD-dependent epimerase/dehydratase family protein [Myxococcota bacterium]
MTLLVTGAAGFIGSHLAERLLATTDQHVVGVDNFDPFYARAVKERNLRELVKHPRFTFTELDLRDRARTTAVYAQHAPEAVFHWAARAGVRPSIEDPAGYVDSNVVVTTTLLQLAAAHATKRFVFASSSSVYGNNAKVPFGESDATDAPISPYAATKKACELLCHTFHDLVGLSTACLRLFTVYGPRQRPDLAIHKFARAILEDRPVTLYGDGGTSRDYTFIADIVDGIMAADAHLARSPRPIHDVFNLGNSSPVQLAELVSLLEEAIGRRARIERAPMQPGDVLRTYADITHARDTFGYDPKTDLRAGIGHFVRWLREQ